MEGKPHPTSGSNSSNSSHDEPQAPGEGLHIDIVFINQRPRLFAVDHASGYMTLIIMPTKTKEDVEKALETLINAFMSYRKSTRLISCDHENVLLAQASYLNKRGIKINSRIPGEHEKIAERSMRVIRERMRTKLRDLPYKLPAQLLDYLAIDCVRTCNLTPNSRSTPLMPTVMVKGEKLNFITDLIAPFGSTVFCPTSDNSNSESKHEIGIVLGASPNDKGGVLVAILNNKELSRVVTRRAIKSAPITEDLIQTINNIAERKYCKDENIFEFRETAKYSDYGKAEDFARTGTNQPLIDYPPPITVNETRNDVPNLISGQESLKTTQIVPTISQPQKITTEFNSKNDRSK
jgi:hypothetical protein